MTPNKQDKAALSNQKCTTTTLLSTVQMSLKGASSTKDGGSYVSALYKERRYPCAYKFRIGSKKTNTLYSCDVILVCFSLFNWRVNLRPPYSKVEIGTQRPTRKQNQYLLINGQVRDKGGKKPAPSICFSRVECVLFIHTTPTPTHISPCRGRQHAKSTIKT